MFLGMQDFDFAQISLKFCPKKFPRGYCCIPSSYVTASQEFLGHSISWAHFTFHQTNAVKCGCQNMK